MELNINMIMNTICLAFFYIHGIENENHHEYHLPYENNETFLFKIRHTLALFYC